MLSFSFYLLFFLLISQAPAWSLFLIQGGTSPFLPRRAKIPITAAKIRINLSISPPKKQHFGNRSQHK